MAHVWHLGELCECPTGVDARTRLTIELLLICSLTERPSAMPRPGVVAPFAVSALTLVSLTACGADYDPCWIEPQVMVEEIFMTHTTYQPGSTWEPAPAATDIRPTYDQATAEPDPELEDVCVYTLTKDTSIVPTHTETRTEILRLGRFDNDDQAGFDSLVASVQDGTNHKEFVEEHREVTIVYTVDHAQAVVGDHLYMASLSSETAGPGDEGRFTAPVMQYLAGTRAGTDHTGYAAWLQEEAERAETEAAAAAEVQAEQDYSEGYAAGVEDGEYEALHGHPPQHYHRELNSRSENWISGFEEGKAEGLASGGTLAGDTGEEFIDLEGEEEWLGDPYGPFDHFETADEPHSELTDLQDPGTDEEVFDEGFATGIQVGSEDASIWGEWLPNSAAFSLHYAGTEQRNIFSEGFMEGYREGFLQGWQDAGKSHDDLPAEARP